MGSFSNFKRIVNALVWKQQPALLSITSASRLIVIPLAAWTIPPLVFFYFSLGNSRHAPSATTPTVPFPLVLHVGASI